MSETLSFFLGVAAVLAGGGFAAFCVLTGLSLKNIADKVE